MSFTATTDVGFPNSPITIIVIDEVGRKWFGTYGGGVSVLDDKGTLAEKSDDLWVTFRSASEDDVMYGFSDIIYGIAVDGTGLTWLTGHGHQVSVLDDGGTPSDEDDDRWVAFTFANGLAGIANKVFIDEAGLKWFLTWHGVSVLDDKGTPFDKIGDDWTTFTSVQVVRGAIDGAGRKWFATWGGGVSVLDDGGTPFDDIDDRWQYFTTANSGLAYDGVLSLAIDSADHKWFGTEAGISVLDDGGTPFDDIDDTWITFTIADGLAGTADDIAIDRFGHKWIATNGGVSQLADGDTPFDKTDDTWTTYTQADGMLSTSTRHLAIDGAGNKWFVTADGVSVLLNAPDVDEPVVIPTPSDEGGAVTASATFSDPGGVSDEPYTCTVNYGDGSGDLPGLVSGNLCTGPAHTYSNDGFYLVIISVTDKDGATGNNSTNHTVNNVAPSVVADNTTVTVNEGDTANNTGTYSDPGDDTVALSASVGTVVDNGDGTWSWSFDTTDGPDESQTVTITGDDGLDTGQATFDLTVNNVAPTIESIALPIDPVNINDQPVSASATFNDPAGSNDEPYTCTVDYGDSNGPQTGTVNGTTCAGPDQTYTDPRVYQITVTVTDKDGGTGSATATDFIVIYDPEGGFVTGAGWIWSPLGAYTDDSSLEGKANFGFVSKYKQGSTVPVGHTKFQFKVADLNFHSDAYQWLVVAGHKAQYKGTGTINGDGNYGFMLTAIDEKLTPSTDVDLFRIKIWDKDDGDTIVYDNQVGDADEADPTTALGGGNIVIHE